MAADLLLLLGIALGLNGLMFLIAYRLQTDTLTDVSYAATFVLVVLAGLFVLQTGVPHFVAAAMVGVWAARLGVFLLARIRRMRTDKRFDGLRNRFWAFGRFWILQGMTVWVVLLPVLLLLRQPDVALQPLAAGGIAVWAVGLVLEVTADAQKARFARQPGNRDRWIQTGLWRYSRHPNYFGEILVWTGMYIFVLPHLPTVGQGTLALAGPLFITGLLLFVSGIPPLEKLADKRWGGNAAYQAYRRRTSVLIPWPPRSA